IESLKSIKEQLRSIPQKGIGYGILRYLSEDISIRQQLSNLPQPQINFNYLGQLDAIVSESSLWKWAKESTGAVRNIQGIRKHLLDVDGFVANGQLQFNWFYSTNIHSRGTIESLAKYFIEALTGLIDLSQSTSEEKFTPADFPQADLSQEELDELISELDILDN
nr:condensation domain-containing protein [Prochloraceae cyanobacterium]